jgi:two-component system chemotaxis response regulator CheB
LQFVLPKLPENLATPITLVQHMPAGFTSSLASRLNDLSKISVVEANDGDRLKPGVCYIAKGGTHLTVFADRNGDYVRFDDSPPVVGLKPCGNIMYNSLVNSDYDEIICVILTGMGADGTKGILELAKHKKVYVIAQDEESSTVYGMPKAIYEKGVVDVVCSIDDVADEITKKVGVR